MTQDRRTVVTGMAGLGLATLTLPLAATASPASDTPTTYGLIGKMIAKPGWRDALVSVLSAGTGAMPGCLSYIIALDAANPDAIWITEVWANKESHAASLQLPAVQAAIAKGRPLIAGFGERFETVPVAGFGS